MFHVINRIGTSRKGTVIGAQLWPTRRLAELDREEVEVEALPSPAITAAALGPESPPLTIEDEEAEVEDEVLPPLAASPSVLGIGLPVPESVQEREAELNEELALTLTDEQEVEAALGAEDLEEVQAELVQVLDEVV